MNDKQLVAIHAAKYVKNDMLVGLGTGSTANFFIEELARRGIDGFQGRGFLAQDLLIRQFDDGFQAHLRMR